MKTCNNCGHSNEDHLQKCHFCNMEGNFTPEAAKFVIPKRIDSTQMCGNCGEEIAVLVEKCPTCHFPVPKSKDIGEGGKANLSKAS